MSTFHGDGLWMLIQAPVIHEWTGELTLNTFKDWIRLYIMLVHIRKRIQGYPPPSINIDAALRRPAWRYPKPTTKRSPSTDLSSGSAHKRPMYSLPSGSASGSAVVGSGGGMADETAQLHAPNPVRLDDQIHMRSFRLYVETPEKEHVVEAGIDIVSA